MSGEEGGSGPPSPLFFLMVPQKKGTPGLFQGSNKSLATATAVSAAAVSTAVAATVAAAIAQQHGPRGP